MIYETLQNIKQAQWYIKLNVIVLKVQYILF